MADSPHLMPTFRSHVSWGIEIGSHRIAVTRTRESRSVGIADRPSSPRARPFAAGAVAGIGTVALLVVGASAAPRIPEPYMVSVAVPGPVAHHLAPAIPHRASTGRIASRTSTKIAGPGEAFDAADEPYVARAMATGAFQEWEDAPGARRFLTAGPARAVNGRYCRAMALMVRFAEGGSRVRSAERCSDGPVSEPTPSSVVGDEPAF